MADTLEVGFATVGNNSIADPFTNRLIDGAAGETYTVLSISICQTNTNETPQMSIFVTDNDGSGTRRHIFKNVSMPPRTSFEHTDKIILEGDDELFIISETIDGDSDVVVTYLKQTS